MKERGWSRGGAGWPGTWNRLRSPKSRPSKGIHAAKPWISSAVFGENTGVIDLAWKIWYALLVSNNKTERAVHFFSTEILFPNNWSKKGTKKLCKVFATGCLFSFDTAQHYISWPVEKIECWLRLRCKDLRMRFYILICCLNCDHIFPVRFKSNQIGWKPQLREFVRKIHQRVWGRKPKGVTKSICWWSTSRQDM